MPGERGAGGDQAGEADEEAYRVVKKDEGAPKPGEGGRRTREDVAIDEGRRNGGEMHR